MARYPTLKEFVHGWKTWGVPALIGIFLPLIDGFKDLGLIGAYYQPAISRIAALLAAMSLIFTYALFVRESIKTKRRWLWIFLGVCALSLGACWSIQFALGRDLAISPNYKDVLSDLVQRGLYLLGFGALASALVTAFLLFPRQVKNRS